ncbi:MAG: SlyX family protein [Polyangiaceae bacterium]
MIDPAELQKRIVDLELRFMRQEKLTEELNDVIVEQQRALDRLTLELRTLREQVLSGTEAAPKDERPPHY